MYFTNRLYASWCVKASWALHGWRAYKVFPAYRGHWKGLPTTDFWAIFLILSEKPWMWGITLFLNFFLCAACFWYPNEAVRSACMPGHEVNFQGNQHYAVLQLTHWSSISTLWWHAQVRGFSSAGVPTVALMSFMCSNVKWKRPFTRELSLSWHCFSHLENV